jgi:hypothetical protein
MPVFPADTSGLFGAKSDLPAQLVSINKRKENALAFRVSLVGDDSVASKSRLPSHSVV